MCALAGRHHRARAARGIASRYFRWTFSPVAPKPKGRVIPVVLSAFGRHRRASARAVLAQRVVSLHDIFDGHPPPLFQWWGVHGPPAKGGCHRVTPALQAARTASTRSVCVQAAVHTHTARYSCVYTHMSTLLNLVLEYRPAKPIRLFEFR
jgi:hypothetical protein